MTDELLNSNSDELVSSTNALVPTATPTCADGNGTLTTASPCDAGDYQSESESEKPVILELGTSSCVSLGGAGIYPLDMHLSNATVYLNPHSQQAYLNATDPQAAVSSLLTSHMSMYNNPYTHSTAANAVAQIRNAYPTHIPQTVCSWPTTELDGKRVSEVVPPPMYVSYMGSRELSIVKEVNPSWKEKALQIEKDYKKTACDRERTRMRDMNRAFDLLRSKLPISKPNGKKYSKIESLRIAINYIHHLQECLKTDFTEISSFSAASKSSRGSNTNFVLDVTNRRQSHLYQFGNDSKTSCDDNEKDGEKSHNGAWSESSYITSNQDQWD